MKVEVITLCWNEIDILPWVIDYWQKFATHVRVFDNFSTDGSDWFLSKFDWISVLHFESGGFNDTVNQEIKNTKWKGSEADFVVVCDMDECLLAKDIVGTLEHMKEGGYTICSPKWYELHCDEYPAYEEGVLLHEKNTCIPMLEAAKTIIFDPKAIAEINYTPGAHRCNPQGRVKWYDGDDLYCLHINHNLSLESKLERYKVLDKRLSFENRRRHHGIHYGFSEVLLTKAWREDAKKRINLNDIINGQSGSNGLV